MVQRVSQLTAMTYFRLLLLPPKVVLTKAFAGLVTSVVFLLITVTPPFSFGMIPIA